MENIRQYYLRKDVQKEMIRLAKDREVQAWFGEFRGRRPEVVNFEGDLKDLVNQGMSSFHISEERWENPTALESGLGKKELDKLRKAWDLILDFDSKNLEFSFIAGELVIEALKFHNVKNYSIKFSGNHGLHIAVPFEAFPKNVNDINIKDYFPDGVRVISMYLKEMMKDLLSARLLSRWNISDIAKSVNRNSEELVVNGKFDPFKAVDIDSVLISNRHLFRCAYSINEKSGLVSIPIKDIKDFNIEDAKPENVKTNLKFLDLENVNKDEAKELLIQAFDWASKNKKPEVRKIERNYEISKVAVKPEFFPPCITKLIGGVKSDGRKRGVFILCNFLSSVGWSYENMEEFLLDWNKRNNEPLRDGYIKSQVSWFRRQNKKVLPPNCENPNYYKSMGIKCEDSICNLCKNPVNYVYRAIKIKEQNKKK